MAETQPELLPYVEIVTGHFPNQVLVHAGLLSCILVTSQSLRMAYFIFPPSSDFTISGKEQASPAT